MLRTPLLNMIGSSDVRVVFGLARRFAYVSSLSSFYENSSEASMRVSSVYMPTIPKASLVVIIKRYRS
jgi:hypothetical protein